MDCERDALGIEDLTYDVNGLIPAVIQDDDTGDVLMVAYMNAESLARTVETGYTWFWSRSRQKYWKKGESSGHVQAVRSIAYDCDADCLLIRVDQTGAACHTMERSCFYRTLVEARGAAADAAEDVLAEGASAETSGLPAAPAFPLAGTLGGLWDVLQERKRELPEGSYTTKLLLGPQDKLLKKIAEESGEVIIAARDHAAGSDPNGAQLTYEIADLLYHLLVVMTREGVTPDALAAELEGRRRQRVSTHDGDIP